MDIVVWLQSLGLGKYEAAFRDNEIDETVLPGLTAEDLKELGVAALGHRRKLLDAIAVLRADAGSKPPAADVPTASSTPSAPGDRAERRQVTVMFSDLVGSTALSARMDPEDLREVISAYQKCVAENVQRFGGFVAKYMGDGVLIYFGYPQAHEDDAERAVRAGLELVAAVGGLKTHAPLQTRVGIATGLVVVGDLIGSGASQEQAIVGETPNLAARLQGIANPNGVVVSESTRKLVGNLFELQDLGGQDLKGIAGSARAWAALRPSSIESRFEALHAGVLTELVGREEELELLLRRWSKAKTGQGQVVLLSGEAGIGKSRLTAALLERLIAGPHTRLRYFCSPQHTDSALYPIISQMERAAGFAHDDTAQAKLDKLDALLAQSFTTSQDAALLSEMLSLPNDGRYPTLELTPQQRRQKTLQALTTQMEALSRSSPVLMIFEDVHWIDPTSLEVLGGTAERLRTLGVLLVVTHRPEFEPSWVGRPHVTALTINRLGEREITALIDRVTANGGLSPNVKQDIVERTDGIPLFVEEMTKAVLEAGGVEASERAVSAIPSPSVAVPASLHASLMARLDRLGSAKEVAQIGAVIGREFLHPVLSAVVGKPEGELKSALERLIDAGLLFRQGLPPHASYLFKHALVRDAAYGALLREPRRSLHARIAKTLESQFMEVAENQPELLARHYDEAGLAERAVVLWGKAAQRSLAQSALVEAAKQLMRALDQIVTLPTTPLLRSEQIKLQVALAAALMQIKGFAAPESKAAIDRARLLMEQAEARGEPPEDPLLLFSVLYGFWSGSLAAFDGRAVREQATEFLTLAGKQTATMPFLLGERMMGHSLFATGDLVNARMHYDRAIKLYDPDEHLPLATRFGLDVRVVSLSVRSWTLWCLGYPDAALRDADEAIQRARESGQATSLIIASGASGVTQICCGDYTKATGQSDEAVTVARDKGIAQWAAFGMINQGCVLALKGQPADAVRLLVSQVAAWRSTGASVYLPWFLLNLAAAYMQLRQFGDARRCIREAESAIEKTAERWCEAQVKRVAGTIALLSPEANLVEAEACFEHALAVARQQQAKSWELRASMSLARLWRSQGKVRQARELLAPVYGWFTEGFDTRDLKEAKALLGELAA
jgi:class 3 adenylate cyclase/predicted ATPase